VDVDVDEVELACAVALIVEHLDKTHPWRRDALCREHPEINWFPSGGQSGEAAVAICNLCTVRDECHQFMAQSDDGHLAGIWAATTGRQRRQSHSKRGRVFRYHATRTCDGCGTAFVEKRIPAPGQATFYCSRDCWRGAVAGAGALSVVDTAVSVGNGERGTRPAGPARPFLDEAVE
jgi:Transcription factor WhiB